MPSCAATARRPPTLRPHSLLPSSDKKTVTISDVEAFRDTADKHGLTQKLVKTFISSMRKEAKFAFLAKWRAMGGGKPIGQGAEENPNILLNNMNCLGITTYTLEEHRTNDAEHLFWKSGPYRGAAAPAPAPEAGGADGPARKKQKKEQQHTIQSHIQKLVESNLDRETLAFFVRLALDHHSSGAAAPNK